MSARRASSAPRTSGSGRTGQGTSKFSRDSSTAYPSNENSNYTGVPSRPVPASVSTTRPKTKGATTTTSIFGGICDQQIICAVAESRGISPTVGLAFVNISTSEALLCQIVDNQTYARTLHMVQVLEPTEILFPKTALDPKSTLLQLFESNLTSGALSIIDRKYWSEEAGVTYIQQLAFKEDIEAIKGSIGANFYSVCCLSAVLRYTELCLGVSFSFHSMRLRYEAPEGTMMIDIQTIHSLELIQNLQNAKSRDCLFGLLNHTLTPMGARLLRSNILQPSTSKNVLNKRYGALQDFVTHEELFFGVRQALKSFLDVDRVLTEIILIPGAQTIHHLEQAVNNVMLLKQYVRSIPPLFESLVGATSVLLREIHSLCAPENIQDISNLIDEAINEDVTYQSKPLDLRNQRTYAVKSGVNGLLDVARQTYKEATADAVDHSTSLAETHQIGLELKYDTGRQYYIQIPVSELEDRDLPQVFINVIRKKKNIQCQTLDLVKWNQKITDSHDEVVQMSDGVVQALLDNIRKDVAPLFKISEAIAVLDMICSFAQLATTQDYCCPELTNTLAVKSGRHPLREKIQKAMFVPNDVYAMPQSRFQIITGCNMSGKSTYIRSIALMAIMAQIGSFVPAAYASFPIRHQLFTRISMHDSIESNTSTFSAEMREMAYILRNIDERSLVIIDELGRGTSTRDGLAIAIAIAEALIQSKAMVWFVTHFRDLARFLAERPGVMNLHLTVDMDKAESMTMLYKIGSGFVQEKHYGLALAKVVDLPPAVTALAEVVSKKLAANSESRRKTSPAVMQARHRKLILSLRDQLQVARDGTMTGFVLRSWLKRLQDEFVIRMVALDKEVSEMESSLHEDGTDDGRSEPVANYAKGLSEKVDDTASFLSKEEAGDAQSEADDDGNIYSPNHRSESEQDSRPATPDATTASGLFTERSTTRRQPKEGFWMSGAL